MSRRKSRLGDVVLAAAVVVLILAGAVRAGEEPSGEKKGRRFGVWLTHAASFEADYDYDYYSLNPYWGLFLTKPGPGYIGAWEFCVEAFFNKYLDDYSGNFEVGLSPTIRYHYGFEEVVSPYFEFSVGVLYTDLDINEIGTEINFDVHPGLGLNFRLSPQTYLSAGYRLRHISNAGMSDRNAGVNYHQFLLGLSYYY